MISRRSFLGATCAGLGVGAGFASSLASLNAFASQGSSYKALVCVFLYGGLDSYDTIIPYDQTSYNRFEGIREPLLSAYDAGGSRRREQLLPIVGGTDGREFALPPELQPIYQLYNAGNAAIVGNVGPLVEPINRQSFLNRAGRRPAKLFSHNDQQSTWMASSPEGAVSGWGGRLADVLYEAGANPLSSFAAISLDRNSVFLTGEQVQPFTTSTAGPPELFFQDYQRVLGSEEFGSAYQSVLRNSVEESENLFLKDVSRLNNRALENNSTLEQHLSSPGSQMSAFPNSSLSEQLKMVAQIIARRGSLGLNRQIFFVSMGGFDTHSGQADKLPALQAELASSLQAFYNATVEMGIQDQVTTFTASDFGRTLGVNGDGTDHGWGGHHLVVGGAVNGGRIHGAIPPAEFEHEFDAGRGRLIPQLSVDQYAGAFGRWFGLSDSNLVDAMPVLKNFNRSDLEDLFL